MVVELYSFTNALQMWTSVEPNALGKSCPHTMSSKDGARKSAGATFPLRAADMNYIQAVDRIILEQVRSLVYRSAWITRTECPKSCSHSFIPTTLGRPFREFPFVIVVSWTVETEVVRLVGRALRLLVSRTLSAFFPFLLVLVSQRCRGKYLVSAFHYAFCDGLVRM